MSEIKDVYTMKEFKELIDSGKHVICADKGSYTVGGKIIEIKEDL